MLDIILSGATVYTGQGGEKLHADVGIQDDRIMAVSNLSDAECGERVDVSSLAVLPGFIDTHTHSDAYILRERAHPRAALQGITTEIVSPCGLSLYPLHPGDRNEMAKYLRGLLGPAPDDMTFTDVKSYLDAATGCAINIAAQAAHGALRMASVGFHDTPLAGEGFGCAVALLEQASDQGAVGFSTGLSYYPATYADDNEVIRLSRVAMACDLPLVTHCRSVFPDNRYNMSTRYREFLDIAAAAGCRVHFSHIKHPREQAGDPQKFLDMFEAEMARGMGVTLEFYPYPSGSGFAVIFLPGWALEGGQKEALGRLGSKRLLEELLKNNEKIGWGLITHVHKNKWCLGMTFEQLGRERGSSAAEALLWLLGEEDLDVGYQANPPIAPELLERYEKDYVKLLQKPYYTIGSDSEPGQLIAHTRTANTFLKMARLVREAGFSFDLLADCQRRAADIFKLAGRGVVRQGAYADLVVLDESVVGEGSGATYVMVNGRFTVRECKITGTLSGRGLRRAGQD